jgi:ATP-dependent DNA helicase RecQ
MVLVQNCLLLDLETGANNSILKIGATLNDKSFLRAGTFNLKQACAELDAFSSDAHCVVGHNLLQHDLALLGLAHPNLKLLRLPSIDTLLLSPVCFPENPYHRLVKEYKLVSESVNDPVADARLSAVLLTEEIQSLHGMAQTAPDVFRCLRFLLCQGIDTGLGQGMAMVFHAADGPEAPIDDAEKRSLLRDVLRRSACKTCSDFLSETDYSTEAEQWALAFIITWLRVAGADSVLPPWVRQRNSLVTRILTRLRDVPCDDPACAYCRSIHNPEQQLNRYFGFNQFRSTPADSKGGSLQRAIVVAGMRNESLLAVMPTGGGKSLCFQLPALLRNYRRGQLTIIVSPLQALMKDQVDGLARRTGMTQGAALNGLLTMPERGAVLRGIRMGNVGLLYVSPEQLRSRSFKTAIMQREIGCWVLDEVHCLSKWGHDFRPDYLYVGRFIRELAKQQNSQIPSITCFTATAKRSVLEEIIQYFSRETGLELIQYQGGVERDNLHFEVQTVSSHAKFRVIEELLRTRLSHDGTGSAVVFRASRDGAEQTAAYLRSQKWAVEGFHAGMSASEKKRIQDAFLSGELRVICSTNAFGMGIDKDDVRLVIHGDTPGSIENYLQEAGRAGRDRKPADCVLLYDEEDCEQQFRLGALSSLSRRDIAQILRGLRKAARKSDEVVITTGELLRDEDVQTSFDAQDHSADTKVRAAVYELERAGFIERNENKTNVIQARLLIKDLEEAKLKLASLNLSEREGGLWQAIVREMTNATATDTLSVDDIAMLPEFQSYLIDAPTNESGAQVHERRSQDYLSAKVLKVFDAMMNGGILKKDTLLTAFVRYKIQDPSVARLQRGMKTERELVKVLRELAPDPEGWMTLNLRLLNDELITRNIECSMEMAQRLLRSLSEDGRGFSGQSGSLDLRHMGRDQYRVRVRLEWDRIEERAEQRRQAAALILQEIIRAIPPDTPPRADVLAEFTFESLRLALEQDLNLRSAIKDMQGVIERALMFMHEQNVIILQKGLAIFRSAMTVRILPEAKGMPYTRDHFEALDHHYKERIFQVHVMGEYARYGLRDIKAALELVVSYFSLDKESFLARFFQHNREFLEQATSAKSYKAIVDSLANRDQIRIVTQPITKNLLILAGPGSGKTRTVVHRCAYLLRVRRVRPQGILVCCFNHKAALELRKRLANLVGRDAIGVTIQTYHGLALRILGITCRGLAEREGEMPNFDKMIVDATRILRGESAIPGVDPDDVRDRLLAGFEHILVDEYQDIDLPQYEMISAIAGRTLKEGERKLSILAVGDDDQSIYAFRGANVQFIRRFKEDYEADVAYLVENYRSTKFIIEAANRVVGLNRDRMKTDKAIRIDQGRQLMDAGGPLGKSDELTRGRVAVVEVSDARTQAMAIVREIKRLCSLGANRWQEIAVLSRTHRDLAYIRTATEKMTIPVAWPFPNGKVPPLVRLREVRQAIDRLNEEGSRASSGSHLVGILGLTLESRPANPWTAMVQDIMEAWIDETGDEPATVPSCIEFLVESLMQRKREERFGKGVILNTVHAAKGTEYDHVMICGDWSITNRANMEEERRALYVGMTRARHTLSVFNRLDKHNILASDFVGPCFVPRREVARPEDAALVEQGYEMLGLEDVFISFAGRQPAGRPIHKALAGLHPGDKLTARADGERIGLYNSAGILVVQLSARAATKWRDRLDQICEIRVIGMVMRRKADVKESDYQALLLVDSWEVPVCEVVVRQE